MDTIKYYDYYDCCGIVAKDKIFVEAIPGEGANMHFHLRPIFIFISLLLCGALNAQNAPGHLSYKQNKIRIEAMREKVRVLKSACVKSCVDAMSALAKYVRICVEVFCVR